MACHTDVVLHVALLEPEIAPNTGSVARTCLAAGAALHLIRPLGFRLTDARLRRSGMDYWDALGVTVHAGWAVFEEAFAAHFEAGRAFALSTRADGTLAEASFAADDLLLFGPESRGLPPEVLARARPVRIPMTPEARSLNLAVAVAVTVYEAWRQLGYRGG